MTYSKVLVFGDSTSAGCELIPGSEDWEETKQLSFGNQLANKLGIQCINYSWPGGSNDRSLRLLPSALLENPNSLVLFAYTSFDRSETFTLDPALPQVQSEGYTGLGACWTIVETNKQHQSLNKLYLQHFCEDARRHNRYKEYNTLLTVQLLCQTYAKNFFHIFLYNNLILPPDFQEPVFNAIDKKHVYQFDHAQAISWQENNVGFGSLNNWASANRYPFCPGGHIGQVAHDQFATELYNKL